MACTSSGKAEPGLPGIGKAEAALSVVIPAFEEEQRLPATLGAILEYLEGRGIESEILVVDDGSSDETAAVAEALSDRGVRTIRHDENRGKGAAIRTGIAACTGARILITDADLSTPIAELERLEPRLDEAEIVMGSRALPDSRVTLHQPIYRELMGKAFNVILRLLGLVEFRDTQCGFKLLEGSAARDLFSDLTIDRFAWDVEMIVVARRRGLRISEVGVEWINSPVSRVQPFSDSLRMFLDVLRIRFRSRR